jgi:protocatechuate 3,4-dioxygenase beta subunit
VVQKATGEAVRKAIVSLTWHGKPRSWATAMTGASGGFKFDSLPAGKYELRAWRNGMGGAVYGGEDFTQLGQFISLADGETRSGLELRIIQPSSISGTVVDTDGDPIAGAEVNLFTEGYPRGARGLVQRSGARTNDRGEYRVTNIQPGRYYIAAGRGNQPMFMHVTPDSPREVLLRQFYGGATDWKRATPLGVPPGELVRGIDFRLSVARAVRIRGRVTGIPDAPSQANNPPQYVQVTLVTTGEGGLIRGTMGTGASPPDYHFEIPDVAPGRYQLTANIRAGNKNYWASQSVDAVEDPGDITLALAPGTDLKGLVRIEGEGAEQFKKFQVTLTRGDLRGGSGDISTQTGPDGRFTLEQVPPGIWDIGVTPIPRGGYLKSMRFGKQDVLTEEMEIGPATDAALNIVVSTRGAKVEGEIDSEAAAQTRTGILLAPIGRYRAVMSFYAVTMPDEDGKFEFSGITPGQYKIFAFEQIPPGEMRNPDQVARMGEFGQPIELSEGGSVRVQPKVIPIEKLREALK